MEVSELQTNDSLTNAFEQSDLKVFYSQLPSEFFTKIRKLATGIMTMFASTYVCEQSSPI
jgi:hypothetical protein